MKSIGMVRKIDDLGRIVLPMELRRQFGVSPRDALEIYTDDDKIILKKYEPACIFCGDASGIVNFEGRNICPNCAKKIGALVSEEG